MGRPQRDRKRRQRLAMMTAATAVVSTGLASLSEPAEAYCAQTEGPWDVDAQNLKVHTSISNAHENAVSNGRAMWNGIASLQYTAPTYNVTSITPYDFTVSAASFEAVGWTDEPARTYSSGGGAGNHETSHTYMNSDWKWFTDGTMNQGNMYADVTTVSGHEFGHSSGLDHPNECGTPLSAAEQVAVMRVQWVYKWDVRPDDIAGIQAIY